MPKNHNPKHESPAISRRKDGVVKFDLDQLPPDQREEQDAFVAEKAGFPRFQGNIEHGYPLTRVRDPGICPRCG